MHKVLFTAGLSNGETIHENKGNFEMIEGALSPWQRLLRYLEETGTTITSLSLYTAAGSRWNLPSAGKNPKFKAFGDAPQPVSFRFFRKMGQDYSSSHVKVGGPDRFSVIEATYQDGRILQVWVDDMTENSWTMITN